MAILMPSPRNPAAALPQTAGAPMNGTLIALFRLWVITGLTATTPGSMDIARILSAVARTLMPLIACWNVPSTVPPIVSIVGTSESCWRRRLCWMVSRSPSEIWFPGARLRTTATGSPAIFSTTVRTCDASG